jgi:thioredoxin reductase/NAD-dependent dihydropyrimidine dehydrogenase PreA subunit
MLITVIGFVLVSAILMALHMRSHRTPAAAVARACPRCGGPVLPEEASCPRCHAPLQAYDVVMAKIAAPETATAAGPPHPLVLTDMCVGCGACVGACPETGALRLVDKIAHVNPDLCRNHGACATACPVGAIVLTTGAAVQRVEVPDLDIHFQSNVPGVYIVGELGGRGLIKNAINEGKLAIEHVAGMVRRGRQHAGAPPDHDVIIVGSGPAGLSAALAASQAGLEFTVLEQGTLSETIQRYPRKKLLFAEPTHIPLYGDLWIADATKESLLRVWQDAIERFGLPVQTHTRVTEVAREDGVIRVRTESGAELTARCVLLAMGRRGTPRRLGVPGEQLDKVFYEIVEMEAFAGQRVLVVGGGDSAIESAVGLSHQPDTGVVLSYRGTDFERARERNRAKLEDAAAAGRVRVLLGSVVREIRPDRVTLEWDGRPHIEPNDVVIVRIGGDPPAPFLQRVGIRIVHKELAIAADAAG